MNLFRSMGFESLQPRGGNQNNLLFQMISWGLINIGFPCWIGTNLPGFATNETLVVFEGSRADTSKPANNAISAQLPCKMLHSKVRGKEEIQVPGLGIRSRLINLRRLAQTSRMLQAQPRMRSVTYRRGNGCGLGDALEGQGQAV